MVTPIFSQNAEPENQDRLLTPSEVASLFRVGIRTVGKWARTGRLTSVRTPGGHRRYRASEVEALLGETQAVVA